VLENLRAGVVAPPAVVVPAPLAMLVPIVVFALFLFVGSLPAVSVVKARNNRKVRRTTEGSA